MSTFKSPAKAFLGLAFTCLSILFSDSKAPSQDFTSASRIKIPELFRTGAGIKNSCGVTSVRALTALNPPEYETYKLTATYYTLNDNLTATLMLNNKGPAPILANPTFYSLAGTRLQMPPITVPATSFIEVDMRQLLTDAGEVFREGSLNITYQGGDKQLGAQVRLVDQLHQLIWAEQMVYTSKFVSSRLENVWWLPSEDTRTRLVISNTSSSALNAILSVDGTNPVQSAPVQITLNPWETRVVDIMRDFVGNTNGYLLTKGGISITHSGAPGALLARMFIANSSHGYSAAVNFVDPLVAASSKWNGNGLRLKNLDGTALNSILVARNISEQTARIRGKIRYANPNGDMGTVLIPATQIAAHTTKAINLGTLITNAGVPSAVSHAGIELEYDTAPGSVITSVLSASPDGNNVFQVPMSDPQKLPSSAGGFPWKADGDFHTLVYIKNETDSTRKFIAYLTYNGGQYATGLKELRGGETAAIDFRELRDNQTPDATGRLIPLDVDRGHIAWSVYGVEDKVLSGRSEQISLSQGIASTYACHNGCPNSYYDGWVDPIQVETEVGAETQFIAVEQDVNGYGQPLSPYTVSANWDSTDWSVASVDSFGMADALDVGSTTFRATWEAPSWWYEITGLCTYDPVSVLKEAPMQVMPPTVTSISASIASTANPVATPAPSPGAYSTTNTSTGFPTESTADLMVVYQSTAESITISAVGDNTTQLKWKIDRNPADTVATGTPTLSATSGSPITLTPTTAGSFRIICYFDANHNNAYDAGEELKVLLFVIVRVTASAKDCTRDSITPSFTWSSTANDFSIATSGPMSIPMSINCTFTVEAGGSNRRIGLNKVHFGDVGNLIADSARVNYATSGYATENPGSGLPMVDTGRVTQGNQPTGGDSTFRENSSDSFQDNFAGGQDWTVISDDSPGFGPYKLVHPNTHTWASSLGGYDFKEFIAGYTTTFPRTYVVVATSTWTIRFIGSRNQSGQWTNNGSSVSASSEFSIVVTTGSPQKGNSAGIQVLGLSYVNQHAAVYAQ